MGEKKRWERDERRLALRLITTRCKEIKSFQARTDSPYSHTTKLFTVGVETAEDNYLEMSSCGGTAAMSGKRDIPLHE